MVGKFHAKPFDDGTLLKLEIFRGYIREWLPVFLSKTDFWHVHVYDFFAGPGSDPKGNPGSPRIILEELEALTSNKADPIAGTVPITLHFNDENSDHIVRLRETLDSTGAAHFCEVHFSESDFADALATELTTLRQPHTANLVLLDQCGMKHVTPEIFRQLASCSTTDMLFFISSSTIRRFCDEPCIQQYLPVDPDEISRANNKEVHRYICGMYKAALPADLEYYLAPFSIQKKNKANIYGVIFGSGKLLGLEKFLRVCWNQDNVTGEANYNIDDDFGRDDPGLWPELNIVKKQDRFRKDIEDFLRRASQTNLEVYRFALESGFLPKHANEVLRTLQRNGIIEVVDVKTGCPARKGAFYVNWPDYSRQRPRVVLRYAGKS